MTPRAAPTGEWRRGAGVLAASTIALGCGANLHYYVSTFFVTGMAAEFGVSRGRLAAVQAIALWGVLAAPLVGRLVDRSGANRVLTLGSVMLGLIYLAAAAMPASLWAPLLAFLAIQSLGQATATVPHTRVVSGWFAANRGLALGIAITGIPLVAALASPALSALIAAQGWRAGYVVLAGLALFVALPLNGFLVREKQQADSRASAEGEGLGDALRSRAFWLLLAAMVLINVPGGGFLNQLVPMLTDGGVSPGAAAAMVSLFAGAVIVGRLASGFLVDRFPPARVAAALTLAPAAGMALLLAAPAGGGAATTALAIALIGIQQGAELDLLAFFTARHFGLRRYATVYGAGYAASVIATSVGLLGFGLCHDLTGSYDLALAASAVTFAAGACCFLLMAGAPARETAVA